MTVTEGAAYAMLALVATAGHCAILRVAVRLMVDVRVGMREAALIVAAEYAAAAVIAGAVLMSGTTRWQVPVTLAAAALVATGAVLIGRRIMLPGGIPAGVGNGVLIQFMQVPMVIPFAILLSFFVVPPF
jgi:hypothetical protein